MIQGLFDPSFWSGLYPNQHPGPQCPWWSIAETFGSPNVQWCEETLCHYISQPANTWSNLVYLLLSCLMWFQASVWSSRQVVANKDILKRNDTAPAGRGAQQPPQQPLVSSIAAVRNQQLHPEVLAIFPWANFFMGLLSFIYHLSNVYPTQMLDFVGMFLTTGWVHCANVLRLRALKKKKEEKGKNQSVITTATGTWSSTKGGQVLLPGRNPGKEEEKEEGSNNARWTVMWIGASTTTLCLVVHSCYILQVKFQLLVLVNIFFAVIVEFGYCLPAERQSVKLKVDRAGNESQNNNNVDNDDDEKHATLGLLLNHVWYIVSLLFLTVAATFSWLDHTRRLCDPADHVIQGHALWHVFSGLGMYALWLHYAGRVR